MTFIRLRGHTVDRHCVKDISGKYIHLVTCNHYEFNKEDNPLCELQKDCNKAIVSRDNPAKIQQCNVTQHPPILTVRTFDVGTLIQGTDVVTKTQDTTGYIVLTKESPVVVFPQ